MDTDIGKSETPVPGAAPTERVEYAKELGAPSKMGIPSKSPKLLADSSSFDLGKTALTFARLDIESCENLGL